MSYFKGRVALVTGASSGMGRVIAEQLVREGLTVVGAARRVERIQDLADCLKGEAGRLIPRKLDVTKTEDVVELYKWADAELGGVDVLINSAAVLCIKPFNLQTVDEWKSVLDTNLLGVAISSREAINSMARRGVKDGHIININSTSGHIVPRTSGTTLGIYPSSKFGITALCKTLRQHISDCGLLTRVTSISPGLTRTEMVAEIAANVPDKCFMEPEDIARTVSFVLNMPQRAEILELIITPTGSTLGGQ